MLIYVGSVAQLNSRARTSLNGPVRVYAFSPPFFFFHFGSFVRFAVYFSFFSEALRRFSRSFLGFSPVFFSPFSRWAVVAVVSATITLAFNCRNDFFRRHCYRGELGLVSCVCSIYFLIHIIY